MLYEVITAGTAAWYEMFPRSQTADPARHGTFVDAAARLPAIADLGLQLELGRTGGEDFQDLLATGGLRHQLWESLASSIELLEPRVALELGEEPVVERDVQLPAHLVPVGALRRFQP